MASKAETRAWLVEHLMYERDMLAFTNELIHRDEFKKAHGMWNIAYESFAVHARVLYEFLSGSASNFKARDFSTGFSLGSKHDVIGAFEDLNQQVFHPAKNRPVTSSEKIDLSDCDRVYAWVVERFDDFVSKLDEPFGAAWADARKTKRKGAATITVTASLSATNHITTVETEDYSFSTLGLAR